MATEEVTLMEQWQVTIEAEGPHEEFEPDETAAALNELLNGLEPYDPVVVVPAPEPVDGVVRYGANLTVSAATVVEACSSAVSALQTWIEKVGLPAWPIVQVHAEANRSLSEGSGLMVFPALLGVAELAERLHVSKARASELARSRNFPPPVVTLAAGPIWLESSVNSYVGDWKRSPGRPRRDTKS